MLLGCLALAGAAAAAAGAYPPTTRSYYEHNTDETVLYNQGCDAGAAGEQGVAILDFGRPAFNGGAYGTIDFGGHFDDGSAIRTAAESYAAGYWDCTPPGGPFMTIAIGTNNSCSTCSSYAVPSFAGAGSAWAADVGAVDDYITSVRGFSSQESASGADDLEPAWSSYAKAGSFVDGYNGATASALWDYGSAETGYWSLGQEYHVAYGADDDFPLPEIYYSGQASEWEDIALWGASYGTYGAVYFPGVTSQWNPAFGDCGYAPGSSYDRLLEALDSHSSTSQSSLGYITDIYCHTV
jgi:hypothetical protein